MQQEFNSTAKGTILIVDDTPDNLRFLSKMLIDSGYEVKRAINGKMALMGIDAEGFIRELRRGRERVE